MGDITNDLKTQAKSMSAEEQEKRKQETEKRWVENYHIFCGTMNSIFLAKSKNRVGTKLREVEVILLSFSQ